MAACPKSWLRKARSRSSSEVTIGLAGAHDGIFSHEYASKSRFARFHTSAEVRSSDHSPRGAYLSQAAIFRANAVAGNLEGIRHVQDPIWGDPRPWISRRNSGDSGSRQRPRHRRRSACRRCRHWRRCRIRRCGIRLSRRLLGPRPSLASLAQ